MKFDSPLQVIIGTLDDIQFVCKWRSSYLQINAGNCETSFRTDKQRVWDAHATQANGKATDFYFMTNPSALNDSDFIHESRTNFSTMFKMLRQKSTNQSYRAGLKKGVLNILASL